MGAMLSALWGLKEDEKRMVLVPPLFEREHVDVTRFMHPPLGKEGPGLQGKSFIRLFEDYLSPGFSSKVLLSSKQDRRSTFISDFRSSHGVGGLGDLNGKATFRFQPCPLEDPYTFGEISVSAKTSDSCLRGNWKYRNVFVSVNQPINGIGSSSAHPQIGLTMASPHFTSGVFLPPSLGLGLPTCYVITGSPKLKGILQYGRENQSLSFGFLFAPAQGLETGIEVRDMKELRLSVFQRMIVSRRVKNPFEKDAVVGITNVVDAGVLVESPLSAASLESDAETRMKMALQWQMNKNICVKGSASLREVGVGIAFKSWWEPTFTCALTGKYDYRQGQAGCGFTVNMENTGVVRYARADRSGSSLAPTQESEASEVEVDTGNEKRPHFSDRQESLAEMEAQYL